jgi:hypothetical protein
MERQRSFHIERNILLGKIAPERELHDHFRRCMLDSIVCRSSSMLEVVREGMQRTGYPTLNEITATWEMENIAGRDHAMIYFGG